VSMLFLGAVSLATYYVNLYMPDSLGTDSLGYCGFVTVDWARVVV
jgi:hypothetical protein